MATVLTNETFDQFIKDNSPVLIDFWATWCGPCRMLSPTVDDLATEYDGRVTVAKCNVDDCEDLASRFGIRNIPTILFFKNGQMVDRAVGLQSKQDLKLKLDSLL